MQIFTNATTTKKRSYFTSHIIFHCFEPFHCCLSVVLWPEERDFHENRHRVVYDIINKRAFESFMCLDRTGKELRSHPCRYAKNCDGCKRREDYVLDVDCQRAYSYHRASIRHLGCMNTLAYARVCVPVSMRYRSSETNYQYGYRHKCI